MQKKSLLPLLNSTVAFILAMMLITTLHELAHLTAALILGHSAIIYDMAVDPIGDISTMHAVIIAGVGPLFSLVSGFLIIRFVKVRSIRSDFGKLLAIWIGFLSAVTGFNYCIVAPIVSGGDTGQVLSLLHAHWIIYAVVFAFGCFGTYVLLPRLFSKKLSFLAHDKRSFFQLGMFPWLYGTASLLVIYALASLMTASLPLFVTIFGLSGVAAIGIFVPIARYNVNQTLSEMQTPKFGYPKIGIIVTVIVAIFVIFGMSQGFRF